VYDRAVYAGALSKSKFETDIWTAGRAHVSIGSSLISLICCLERSSGRCKKAMVLEFLTEPQLENFLSNESRVIVRCAMIVCSW
jgi:hypothetical protein